MADRMTAEQRHRCMSRIRGKDTKPELMVRRFLYAHGYRFRLHVKRLPGTPDIVMRRLRTVILVNGCFWHGHTLADGTPCRLFVMPRSRREFWEKKIYRNQERDIEVRSKLTSMGWNVISLWECDLQPKVAQMTLQRLLMTLNGIEIREMKNEKCKMNGPTTTRNEMRTPCIAGKLVNSEERIVNSGRGYALDGDERGRMVADDVKMKNEE